MKLAKELTTANSLVNDSESEDEAVLFVIATPVMLDEDLNQIIQSLNNKQHLIVIHQWAREFVKNKSAKVPTKIDPFAYFYNKYR